VLPVPPFPASAIEKDIYQHILIKYFLVLKPYYYISPLISVSRIDIINSQVTFDDLVISRNIFNLQA
ncbi:MAG: hypothetical protein KJ882_09330, partial [Proteobacteria bacterium]|nr:hypothetical protein [Pseudomonadota bacterium]